MVRELTENETDARIERHIEPHPDPVKQGYAWYRLKERGVPVYAIIGGMTPSFDNADDVADAYARLWMRRWRTIIITRLRLTLGLPRTVPRRWRCSISTRTYLSASHASSLIAGTTSRRLMKKGARVRPMHASFFTPPRGVGHCSRITPITVARMGRCTPSRGYPRLAPCYRRRPPARRGGDSSSSERPRNHTGYQPL
jgi:hypothetical protein